MTTTMNTTNWVSKLNIKVIEEKDGSATIFIEWDEKDPDLDYWNALGKEGQQKLIMDGLMRACENLGITTKNI